MQHHLIVLVAALFIVLPSASVAQDDWPDLETRVDIYLEPYLATGNFTGSILIGHQDKVLLSKGYGFSNRGRTAGSIGAGIEQHP